MTSHWQRKRQPEDVPTPVAVAVSDFCRRAQAAASPQDVREALALLAEADDFRVRTLTDAEPEARPLGPFALVDVLQGTPAAVAAQRQGVGYYDVARELARVREDKRPAAPPPAPEVPRFVPPAPAPSAPAGRGKKAAEPSVADRIAPRKRQGVEEPAPELPPLAPESAFRKRDLPAPRGRFSNVAAPKASFQGLTRATGKDVLLEALDKSEHRYALHKLLANAYAGPRGGDLKPEDVDALLSEHGLLDALAEREKARVLAAYAEQRGAAGRVAWSLGLSPAELERLVKVLGLREQVEETRERFRREVLAEPSLTRRLDLLGREKYLMDLGVKKRFHEVLRRELEKLAREELADADSLPALAERVARKHAAPADLVLRALERLDLADAVRERLAASPSRP